MSNIKKIYTCSYCSKTFSKPSALRPHVYTHTGEKPYICHVDGCGRQFSVVSNLRRHFKVHTAPANKSALSTRQHQRKGQHSTIRAPQHRITETSPPPMPRRLLPAIPSSSSPISAPSMINTIVPSSTADDIIVATAPPILSVFSSNPDDNGHMSMWMNPCMPDYAYNAQPFVDNSHNLSSEGVPVDTTTSLSSPCSTNTFSFQFYMDTTESSMTALYTTNDSSNSRLVSSHMCSSLF